MADDAKKAIGDTEKTKEVKETISEDSYYMMEYNTLKDAHFQTSQQITSFFQFSLLIFSAPLALVAIKHFEKKPFIALAFMLIGIVGHFVLLYLSKMRCEALLYARNINRIRSILYTKGILGKDPVVIHEKKLLFSQDKKPNYLDIHQFGLVVLALSIFSSGYFVFGLYLLQHNLTNCRFCRFCLNLNNWQYLGYAILFILCCGISYAFYHRSSINAERGVDYFHDIIGVDIDGVLNKHEEQFVRVFNQMHKKQICENDITTLPVHKSGLVTLEEEQRVFLNCNYWKDMPSDNDAIAFLNLLIKDRFNYKIHIFTNRNWNLQKSCSKCSIKDLTKNWLKSHNVKYDKITFEKGKWNKTRYFASQKRGIKFFIEDDLHNALKLSCICEYVFLIDHAYNHDDKNYLPYNVIRITSWDQLAQYFEQLQ